MRSKWEEMFALHCRVEKLEVQRELVFAPPRKWRFDFALPEMRLAIEIEGGTWAGGRHTRGSGFEKDSRKYNAAAKLGWRVLRYTGAMVESGEAVNDVLEIKRGDVMDEAMKKIAEFAFNHADVHLTTTGSMFAACEAVLAEAQRREAPEPQRYAPGCCENEGACDHPEQPAPADVVERAAKAAGNAAYLVSDGREGPDVKCWGSLPENTLTYWRDVATAALAVAEPVITAQAREGYIPAQTFKALQQSYGELEQHSKNLGKGYEDCDSERMFRGQKIAELQQQLATMYTKEQVENFLLRFGQLNSCGALMGKVSREMRAGITAPKPEPTPQERVTKILKKWADADDDDGTNEKCASEIAAEIIAALKGGK